MKTPNIILLSSFIIAAAFPSCTPKPRQLTTEQLAFCEQQGKETAQALGETLLAQLQGAMASGDINAAITVCQAAAQPITAGISEDRPGVTIRRTSLKYRNAKNAPDTLDHEVLQSWESSKGEQRPLVRQTGPNSARFYAPIFIKEACLNCHGPRDSRPETLTKTLAALYPNDLAHGYALGDLRGAFRVDIDLTKATSKSTSSDLPNES